ncbi:hypothetical protein SBV1_3310007 [Verrucomicrobia bacterium]|nr:hypothetical protein SBV1_3310007 [Verrucomicrobiota bacterium]
MSIRIIDCRTDLSTSIIDCRTDSARGVAVVAAKGRMGEGGPGWQEYELAGIWGSHLLWTHAR